jgi:predicted nucleic acid-binding protein
VTRYVIDASVLAKCYFPEHMSDLAVGLFSQARSGDCVLMAPDLVLYELGSVVLKKLRNGLVLLEDATAVLQDLRAIPLPERQSHSITLLGTPSSPAFRGWLLIPLSLMPAYELAVLALTISQATLVTFYDAVYLAGAQAADARLVTADEELVRQARRTAFGDLVLGLPEIAT